MHGMRWSSLVAVGLVACGPTVVVNADGSSTSTTGGPGSASSPSTTAPPSDVSSVSDAEVDVDDGSPHFDDFGVADLGGGGCDGGCAAVDVLFVIDNSGSMAEEQLALARAGVRWIGQMLADGGSYDVQVMITTTDIGNPLCTPFQPPGYDPAQGAPTMTGCNSRIDDFTGLGSNPISAPEACTAVCPSDITPGDPFLAIDGSGSNVPDVPDADVDGDGVPDSPEAQALACMLPQGINGCGYESPLEAMLLALEPGAAWNSGDRPFVRDNARLAIVIVTDESDCSVQDYSVVDDDYYFNVNPDTGLRGPSSALCWNAGVTCTGPDANGVYTDCVAAPDGPLQEVTRYTTYLSDYLVGDLGKTVDVFALTGVPEVTEYSRQVPFEPTAGGIFDLVVHDWQDGVYPAGDILPEDAAAGVDAAQKHFLFGIGPACTGQDAGGDFTGQAVPNIRVFEVCQALDAGDAQHCFIDSICAPGYDGALGTLWGTMVAQLGGD